MKLNKKDRLNYYKTVRFLKSLKKPSQRTEGSSPLNPSSRINGNSKLSSHRGSQKSFNGGPSHAKGDGVESAEGDDFNSPSIFRYQVPV